MSLDKKLDEIRRKPEYIRKRYVWISVILCMIFVLIIWFFSLKTNFSNTNNENTQPFTDIQEQFNETEGVLPQMPSIEDFVTAEGQISPENTSKTTSQEQQPQISDTNTTEDVNTFSEKEATLEEDSRNRE